MKEIIAIANQKGGVGKTTTSINLASCLVKNNYKVLLIDFDPQGNCTSGIGLDPTSVEHLVHENILQNKPLKSIIKNTSIKNLDIVPSNLNLATLETLVLKNNIKNPTKVLKASLSELEENDYDFIIIDCPPSLSFLSLNALNAATSVLIPIQCEFYALEGLGQLMNTINLVKKRLNKNLEIEGALLTMYDMRTNLSNQVVKEVSKYFGNNVYKTVIPRNVKLSEAPSYGMSIIEYDSRSKGAKAYDKLAKEFIKKNEATVSKPKRMK